MKRDSRDRFRPARRWLAASLVVLAAARAAAAIDILVLGDSLSAGYGLPRDAAFPAQLEAALRARGIDVRVVNAGVSGDTTTGGRARLGWTLAEPPDLVILELGANDGLRGIPPELTRDNLAAMLETLRARRIPVILTGIIAPGNLGREYTQAFDSIFAQLAARFSVPFYPFFLAGVAGETALNLGDGLHPNRAGIAVIVERILPLVAATIQDLPGSR